MPGNYKNALIAITMTACLNVIPNAWAGQLTIENPWVRSAPPAATVLAAYMTIHNHSDTTATLTSVSSPAFESVQLHRTTLHDGMMHMEAVKTLAIEAGGTVKLKPSSYHLMLSKPKQTIKSGDTIPFTLNFGDKSETVTAVVRQDEEESTPHHHH